MKALANMARIQVNHELLLNLLSVYESKGKEFYYDELFSRDKNTFERKTVEDNLYYLGKFLMLDLTDARLKLLAKKDLLPKNKTEQLYLNMKRALSQMQKFPKEFELLVNEVDNLARLLSKQVEPINFRKYEKLENLLVIKKEIVSTKDDLDATIALYMKQVKTKQYELTQLITNFYIDFMNLDILAKHNELVGYILLYALLLRDFNVFKYVSFFEAFLKKKEVWIKAYNQAKYYWDTGYPQTDAMSKVIIEILQDCYIKVDALAYEYNFEKGVNKSDNIENTILKGAEIFTKEDIRLAHPTVSEATIDRTLKRLKEENKVRPLGKGRSSKWSRLVEGRSKLNKSIDLFSFGE